MSFGTRAGDEKPQAFAAKFDSRCKECGHEIIAEYDMIWWSPEYDAYLHEGCG